MLIYTASIDSRDYVLASAEEVDRLKELVLEAVHAGGKFIDTRSTAARLTSVLVTAATPVSFDTHESGGGSGVEEAGGVPFSDYDHP